MMIETKTGPKKLWTQAERVIEKFGGARRLAACMGVAPSTVYRWTYPRTKHFGTGGLIPTAAWPEVEAAARREGILITPEDRDHRPYYNSDVLRGEWKPVG